MYPQPTVQLWVNVNQTNRTSGAVASLNSERSFERRASNRLTIMKPNHRLTIALPFVLGLLVVTSDLACNYEGDDSSQDSAAFRQLKQLPLSLPALSAGERCPVTHGSRDTVPKAGYIFCSGCFWYGKGPVFFALAWSDQSTDDARFPLDRVPYEERAYRAKTPWVSKPDYTGPILIRGRLLTGSEKLRFASGGSTLTDAFELEAPVAERTEPSHWSFWPTSMFVPRAGCYGIQIDTPGATDVVVFEATRQR
jgi:hypothetical protein